MKKVKKIETNQTGKSDSGQACAFIEYSTQMEAQTAITTLNNNYEIREGNGKIVCRFYEKPEKLPKKKPSLGGRGGKGLPMGQSNYCFRLLIKWMVARPLGSPTLCGNYLLNGNVTEIFVLWLFDDRESEWISLFFSTLNQFQPFPPQPKNSAWAVSSSTGATERANRQMCLPPHLLSRCQMSRMADRYVFCLDELWMNCGSWTFSRSWTIYVDSLVDSFMSSIPICRFKIKKTHSAPSCPPALVATRGQLLWTKAEIACRIAGRIVLIFESNSYKYFLYFLYFYFYSSIIFVDLFLYLYLITFII